MPGRLFWKILIGFWITFIFILEGMWVSVFVYGSRPKPFEMEVMEQVVSLQLSAAASIVGHDGPEALAAVMASWPDASRPHIVVSAETPGEAAEAARQAVTATAPDHQRYRISWRAIDLPPPEPFGPFDVPNDILILGIFGGLGFSAILAWYLTRPIETLQRGFRKLALGDLAVRLGPLMGRRRDEIADLAGDFDEMAGRLQQLVALRDQLLHDVSHELRSPLARLHVAVGLIRQNPQRLAFVLERIEGEARRLDAMVGELLTLSRVESGSGLQDSYFDLGELMQALLNDARFEAQAQGIAIEGIMVGGPDASPPTVRGNAELVRRAIENIVRNALRFSAAGDRICVTVEALAAEKRFRISVADHGPGVPAGQLSSIFEPFVRAGNQGETEGFGLGLAIARRTILAHNGSVTAQNAPAGGLVVVVELPFGPSGV